MADNIAVLAAPGKLIASGTPVELKNAMGTGYSIAVKFLSGTSDLPNATLAFVRQSAPQADVRFDAQRGYIYALNSKDAATTASVIRQLETHRQRLGIDSYEVLSTTIEDIFLHLIKTEEQNAVDPQSSSTAITSRTPLRLATSRPVSPINQALTIFSKRILLSRSRWLLPVSALALGIIGSWAPLALLSLLDQGSQTQCLLPPPSRSLSFDLSVVFWRGGKFPAGPPNLTAELESFPEIFSSGFSRPGLRSDPVIGLSDKESFIKTVNDLRINNTLSGALYADFDTGDCVGVWSGTSELSVFNIYSNVAMRMGLRARSVQQDVRISTSLGHFAQRNVESMTRLFFILVLGFVMVRIYYSLMSSLTRRLFFSNVKVIYTSFATIHVTEERNSNVQAMMLSNGLANPLGLWLGHLLYDCLITTVVSVVVIVIYAAQMSKKFQALGLFVSSLISFFIMFLINHFFQWLVIWLYGLAGTLYAYLIAMLFKRPLAAFGACLFSQLVIYVVSNDARHCTQA